MWTEKIMDRELATAISDVLIELASEIVQASARFLHEAAHRPRKPLRKNIIYSYKVSIRNLHDVLEDIPMRGLKIHHIRHYVNERNKETGHSAIIQHLGVLSTIMSYMASTDDD